MKTGDHDRDRGREGDGEATNVVRLPRDWLGPRDELVPFGPSAYRSAGSADAPTRADHDRAISQVDFWGGELTTIPGPLVGPAPAASASVAGQPSLARSFALRIARSVALPRPRLGSARARAVTIAGSALIALAVIVVIAMAPGRGQVAGRPDVSPGLLALAGRGLAGMDDGLARLVSVRVSPIAHSRARHVFVARRRCNCARHLHVVARASSPVRSAPTYVVTPSRAYVAPVVSQQAGSSASVHSVSHQASSTATPAFGPNGSLGPGHSPNG